MEIKTKYNINDKIAVKDYKDNIILTTINRIETYATDTNLDIKYITKYGIINENQTININEVLNELNDTNDKKQDSPIEVITMSFRFDEPVKTKYNVGQLVEYDYKGEKYISIIENINLNNGNITYKLIHDYRNFVETEIKPIKLNVNDDIVYFKYYETKGILYRSGTITNIHPNYVVVKNNDDYDVNIGYDQILKRI